MTLAELLAEFEPLDLAANGEAPAAMAVADSLSRITQLVEKIGKAQFRLVTDFEASNTELTDFVRAVEASVSQSREALEAARQTVGELQDREAALAQLATDLLELSGSATAAAKRELTAGAAEHFAKLQAEMLRLGRRLSLEPLAAEGMPFDASIHEAVETLSTPEKPGRMVVEVVRQGYRYRGEVIRIARVVISE